MKKILSYHIYTLLLICIAAGLVILSSCEKENTDPPSISHVRNYAASPNDTILNSVSANQWVVLIGKNLSGVTRALFGTTPATINNTFFSDTCIVIQIPEIPFQSIPRNAVNAITVVNEHGTATYNISITGTPIITQVKNYAAAPNDTVVNAIVPNQKITLIGYNLKDAAQITFQGIAVNMTDVQFTDSTAIVQVPADLSGADASLSNMISVTNRIGTGTFGIRIIGPPLILSISHEIPKEGDSVYIYGNNLSSVQALTFAGATISSYKENADGSRLGFISPALSDAGPVSITTLAGSFTTAFKVNDINFINAGGLGILGNMEWSNHFGWAWWGGSVDLTSSDPNSGWPSYNATYGVGTGMYLVYKSPALNAGEGSDGNAIRLGEYEWVPTENHNDAGDKWAIKFDINVKKTWNGGTICIRTNNASYLALYEPWKISATKSAPYTTKGWQTVTIPLSEFRLKDATLGDGRGASITKVSDLLDIATGKTYLTIYLKNYGTDVTGTSFEAAFDNFRVTKR